MSRPIYGIALSEQERRTVYGGARSGSALVRSYTCEVTMPDGQPCTVLYTWPRRPNRRRCAARPRRLAQPPRKWTPRRYWTAQRPTALLVSTPSVCNSQAAGYCRWDKPTTSRKKPKENCAVAQTRSTAVAD